MKRLFARRQAVSVQELSANIQEKIGGGYPLCKLPQLDNPKVVKPVGTVTPTTDPFTCPPAQPNVTSPLTDTVVKPPATTGVTFTGI